MISFSNIAKSFGQQTLFRDVSFQFNPGNRYGLVGANGSGKSTFLKMMSGLEMPSEGTLNMPKKLRLGVLEQDHFKYETFPILHVVMMGHQELWQAMDEKEKLLAKADQEFDGERYAELEDLILRYDGYSMEARAAEILEGLGIPTEVHDDPLSSLSGGFKLRVLLAQVLAASPECLLLDEPTNHLDILSIRWLEKFLVDYPRPGGGDLPRPSLPRQRVQLHRRRGLRNHPALSGKLPRLPQGQGHGARSQRGGDRQTGTPNRRTPGLHRTASKPRLPKPGRPRAR